MAALSSVLPFPVARRAVPGMDVLTLHQIVVRLGMPPGIPTLPCHVVRRSAGIISPRGDAGISKRMVQVQKSATDVHPPRKSFNIRQLTPPSVQIYLDPVPTTKLT